MSTNEMWDDPHSNSKAVAVFDRTDTFVGLRGKRGEVIELVDAQEIAAPGGSALVGADDGASGSLWTTVAGFIAFLMSSLGASVIGFIQSGVGAAWRSIMDKLRERKTLEDFGGVADGATDNYPAYQKAIAAGVKRLFLSGDYAFSQPLVMATEGLVIEGDNMASTIIRQAAGFSGAATVDINGARLQALKHVHVRGSIAGGSDALRITSGQMCSLENVMAKEGVAGIRLISGNSQRWRNVFAESNTDGIVVEPDAGDNTNGCVMDGVRAYNNTGWGIDVKQGAGANGHMHSSWDVSAENNGNGCRVRAGRYCRYTLYAEANTTANFDLDPAVPHYYFLKNPDSSADGALHSISSKSAGYSTSGGNLYLDLGYSRLRVKEQVFTASASLASEAVGIYYVTNTSGSTRSMTLSFLSYAPVGFTVEIIKTDNTPGLTPVAPDGITLVGKTATFGASVAAGDAAVLRVRKINSTTAVLM